MIILPILTTPLYFLSLGVTGLSTQCRSASLPWAWACTCGLSVVFSGRSRSYRTWYNIHSVHIDAHLGTSANHGIPEEKNIKQRKNMLVGSWRPNSLRLIRAIIPAYSLQMAARPAQVFLNSFFLFFLVWFLSKIPDRRRRRTPLRVEFLTD